MLTFDGAVTFWRFLMTGFPTVTLMFLLRMGIFQYRTDIIDEPNRVRPVDINFLRDQYDFIIIGGGSAGSVLAARLSEVPNWNVLLLEAGSDEPVLADLPQLYPVFQRSPWDWMYKTEPSERYCQAMQNRQCFWPRGKLLGGSSSINAMMYVRGNRRDYDHWAELGNPGWSYRDVLPYFLKLEDMRVPGFANDSFHRRGGPVSIEQYRFPSPLRSVFMEAARELNMLNPFGDFNGRSQMGFASPHGTLRDGLRCSANKAYLRPVWRRDNLDIILYAFVERINIEPRSKRAQGVTFQYAGLRYTVRASREVILSAGAIASPQLLMVSGIGPRAQLEEHGVRVLHHLPGVGRNLQDHVSSSGAQFTIENPVGAKRLSFVVPEMLNVDSVEAFLRGEDSFFYALPICEVMGFVNTKYQDPRLDWPDIQLFLGSYGYSSDGGLVGSRGSGISFSQYAETIEPILYKDTILITPLLMRPRSRGWIELQSAHASVYPRIHANYFDNPLDMAVLVEGMKFAHRIAETPIMRRLNTTLNIYEWRNCPDTEYLSDAFWECIVRFYTQTIYHPVGTCKMGPARDPTAVVDARLRVHGVQRLRVIDGSIMPTITTGNTNTPILMIAEKAADMIKADWRRI